MHNYKLTFLRIYLQTFPCQRLPLNSDFHAFSFIFYFSSITTPWDSKIFCYRRRHVRNWLLLLEVKNNQSAVYRVLVSRKRQFLLNSSLSLEHAHLLMLLNQQKRFLNFQTHFLSYVQAILSKRTQILKQNCSPKPTLSFHFERKRAQTPGYLTFPKKARQLGN